MKKSIFLAGSGGHGIQIVGKTIVTACNTDATYVTYSPRYGVEKRGGLSSCYIVVSDGRIGNPRETKHDVAVLMEPKSYTQYRNAVKPGGILIVNGTLIGEDGCCPDGACKITLPISRTAVELGSEKTVSAVLLGVLAGLPGIVDETERLKQRMLEMLVKKPALLPLNERAFDAGIALVQNALKEQGDA